MSKEHKASGPKTMAIQQAYEDVVDILNCYGSLEEYGESKIYVMSSKYQKHFDVIEDSLGKYRTGTRRGMAYSINKMVKLLNPDKPAFQYSYTNAFKYAYISNKDTCIKEAQIRVEISANIQRKKLREHFEKSPEYTDEFKRKLEKELEEKIELEREKVNEIVENPTLLKSIRISGFKNRIEYGQVNYGYYGEGEIIREGKKITVSDAKLRTNSHLSIVYPNVLFYDPDPEADKHKTLMEAKYLEQTGYIEICRDVFVKYKDSGLGEDDTEEEEENNEDEI